MSVLIPALSFLFVSACITLPHRESSPVQRIAFGSCFQSDGPSEIWATIADYDPELFILLGDNIYADTEDMQVMRGKYARLDSVDGFARLRTSATILATWDDHDYGVNDGGADYPMRKEAQQVFLDFQRVPKESARRKREGIFHARILGSPGQRVQVILLDTRYFRGPLMLRAKRSNPALGTGGPYRPNTDPQVTVLGEAQWKWLEDELRKPAELRILASSIQLAAEDHDWEAWINFPLERKRLLETISGTGAEGVIAISGDRHKAEISILDPERARPGSAVDTGYPLIDVTSSSLNRPSTRYNEVNRHRVGSVYHAENFGTIEVDWKTAGVVLAIRSLAGAEVIRYEVSLHDLARRE